jgi:hypothetical protein
MHQDKLKTKPATKKYIEGWNRVFSKKKQLSKSARFYLGGYQVSQQEYFKHRVREND